MDKRELEEYTLPGDPEVVEAAYNIVGFVLLGGVLNKEPVTLTYVSQAIGENPEITRKAIELLKKEDLLSDDCVAL